MATKISVTSTAFTEGQSIPRKYTCDGDNVNPPLTIENVPAETKSLVLIVDDPDAPGGTWDHWVVWDIPAVTEILENSVPGTQGMNDSERQRYSGPCPPSGTHRYFFKVYALDTLLGLDPSSTKRDVEEAMKGHILAQGQLIGTYSRE
ncbi:MAG: YbhB/YbcL family Raf kinase inhibitor-like protein [Cyclobacteriaceae bacterium]|jgi:Raf kinase inhibitor-like YbhB/YbcL family protein|nr:YbhB/YbcL family Raf kinase inhibitor-like protein [Cyclobacteriaceae bacterium]